MKKIRNRKYKINTIVLLLTFLMLIAVASIGVIVNNFAPFNLGVRDLPVVRLIFAVLLCSVIGTIATKLASKKAVDTIIEIEKATKEIASGNYNIRIEEKSNLIELDDMSHNFNLMAKDLAMNEMMKSDFINNVSHDFKTPLAAIEGYATLLKNKNLPPEKMEEYANHILFNSKRLTKMTSNILLLSTLDNSRIVLNKSDFSLDEQIREMILLYENEWSEKNLDLDIDLATVSFNGDKDLLSHVWQNLISNAVKFCDDNGTISVKLTKEDNKIQFSISNTGGFIKKEDLPKIFEKFYQTDTSRASKGNGLGLSIVKKVVDLHGGEILISSEEDKMTEFIVQFII